MAVFTFSATVDSKGRVVIPARIRNQIGLEEGDQISLSIEASKVVVEEVGSYREAIEFVESFNSVDSFCYSNGVVEVVLNG